VRCRDDGQENRERAVAVIRSALLDRIGRGYYLRSRTALAAVAKAGAR
jgi:hypothetical protein